MARLSSIHGDAGEQGVAQREVAVGESVARPRLSTAQNETACARGGVQLDWLSVHLSSASVGECDCDAAARGVESAGAGAASDEAHQRRVHMLGK